MTRQPTINPLELDWSTLNCETPAWFRDAKFGLFFHWGPYTVPACDNEWYSRNMYARGLPQNVHHVQRYGKLSEFGYKDFFDSFTGERFDPGEWADLIVRSGARYAGPVTEHADNFSMWASTVNPVNSVNYGPHRDVVGELRLAIVERGLKFAATFHHQWLWGWFMSSDANADVYDPANEPFYGPALPLETNRYIPWRLPDERFNETWLQKVVEVLDRYDPDLVYFDSRTCIIDEHHRRRMVEHCRKGPTGRADRVISYKQNDLPDEVGILDVECGRFDERMDFAWQTDDRLEARRTWCYVDEPHYKSATTIIHQLCDVVSKNGNLLLNVGPRVDGTFADEAVATLHDVGAWLQTHGEAIYGTRPFAVHGEGGADSGVAGFGTEGIEAQTRKGDAETLEGRDLDPDEVRFTTAGDAIYVIVPVSRKATRVRLASLGRREGALERQVARVEVIGDGPTPEYDHDARALAVEWRGALPSSHANVLRVTLKGQR